MSDGSYSSINIVMRLGSSHRERDHDCDPNVVYPPPPDLTRDSNSRVPIMRAGAVVRSNGEFHNVQRPLSRTGRIDFFGEVGSGPAGPFYGGIEGRLAGPLSRRQISKANSHPGFLATGQNCGPWKAEDDDFCGSSIFQ